MTPAAQANHLPYSVGDVFVATGQGMIKRFTPTGALVEILDTTSGSQFETGMCFDSAGNLRATNFSTNSMTLFDNKGAVLQHPWGGPFNAPSSCVVDNSGNVYVGQAGGNRDVLKFNAAGTSLGSFNVAVQAGSGWIDLAADQKTLLYTSQGPAVKRYDVSSSTQLPDLASGLPGTCDALRIRSNGEVMVACSSGTVRLSPAGAVIQTYPASFALSLDPDGTTFWWNNSGTIVRSQISTGAQVASFNAGSVLVAGLVVFGPPTSSCANPPTPTRVGTPGNDFIIGDSTAEVIDGLGGSDAIFGGGGDDFIIGGDQGDALFGEDGDDVLCGGDGSDALLGGNGNDRLFGGNDSDVLAGGPGANDLDGGLGIDNCVNGTKVNC